MIIILVTIKDKIIGLISKENKVIVNKTNPIIRIFPDKPSIKN